MSILFYALTQIGYDFSQFNQNTCFAFSGAHYIPVSGNIQSCQKNQNRAFAGAVSNYVIQTKIIPQIRFL